MADNARYIQAQKFSLAVGISTTATSITLNDFNFPDGSAITTDDLALSNFGTLEPGTEREEQISFSGFTTNGDGTITLTGVTRGLAFGAGNSYSEQAELKIQHGTGSTFVISNTAGFYDTFVNKNNDETMTGFLSVPTPTSSDHAATKGYVDTAALGGATVDRIVVAGTAGESVAAGDLVYFDDTDNEWKKTDANTAATIDNVLLGIAQGAGSDGVSISNGILTSGVDNNQTGLTVGVKLYASDTAGEITESAGSNEKVIGWSKSATEVYFDPNFNDLPTSDEKDAMAGGGDFGTPDTDNKFITEDFLTNRVIRRQYDLADSPATWTKQDGLKFIQVEAWGGGGNGAARDGSSSRISGGGGGAYVKKIIAAADLSATETVTVGGAATNSTFGALVTGYRGGNGTNSASDSVCGGSGGSPLAEGNNGSTAIQANAPEPGYPSTGTGLRTNEATTSSTIPIGNGIVGGGGGVSGSGDPGTSIYGGGGGGGPLSTSGGVSVYGGNGGRGGTGVDAEDGQVPGGGGGACNTNGVGGTSGSGGAGRIIVTEYYI